MRQLIVMGTTLIWLAAYAGAEARQANNLFGHEVSFGDTWVALSLRYQVPQSDLQAANPWQNQALQPAPGQRVLIPDIPLPERHGRVRRLHDESLLGLALRTGRSPHQIAQLNGLASPYGPPLYQAILLPDETTTVRELPARFRSLQLSRLPAVPGQALALRGETDGVSAAKVDLRGLPFMTASGDGNRHIAVGGTGAFYPIGRPTLNVVPAGHPRWSQPWPFVDGSWEFQAITLTGAAAQIDAQSIAAERERLYAIWTTITPQLQLQTSLQLPIEQYLQFSSLYGVRRSYNVGPYRSYHEGVDFSAYGGTDVLAAAHGTVVLAEFLYVRGGSVIIDHGLGIYSGVYHLSAINVVPGQAVEPGDLVGAVGTTGLSTGNHLHWDLLVNGVWVDALSWYNQDLSCWLLEGLGRPCG